MKRALALASILVAATFAAFAAEPAGRTGYYRFPAIHGDTVVFVSEGDLWTVDVRGGAARRLTSHTGVESSPAISPDGRTLAFSAQYEGPTEVYTMPLTGGLPARRTFSGLGGTVVGWTPDGKILYGTQKYATLPNTQLVVLDPAANAETVLPLAQAADGSFEPSGKTLYFTRLPFQGSYTKRYKGGTAQNLWSYALGADEAAPLTSDYTGTSKNPMVWKDRVYFLSDRDGSMNIWSMDLRGGALRQHTFHKGFDASSPSLDAGRVAYQLVADLRVYDIAADRDEALAVTLPSDFDQMRERWVNRPLDYLTSGHVSPNGDRAVFVSRGHVFVAPVGDGRWVRVTRREGVRARAARFMGDGKSLMVLTDETGEWEFHRYPADGLGPAERLTDGAKVLRFDGLPSPDGKWLAFADKDYQLWLLDVAKKSLARIAVSEVEMFSGLAWSPDSRWLAYVEGAPNGFSRIVLHEAATGRRAELTNDRVDSYGPAWSPDGKWLYFLSDRYFESVVGSPWGARQPEPYFDKTTKIYAAALSGKDPFPFAPATELQGEKKEPGDDKGVETKAGAAKDAPKPAPGVKVEIALPGLSERVFELPLPPGVYGNLAVGDKALFFIDEGSNAAGQPKLQAVEIKNRGVQARTIMDDVRQFELTADGKKLFVRKGGDLYVIDAGTAQPTQQTLAERRIDLSKWAFSVDPREEWRQMLVDAWRMERDYFYDRDLHNVDYEGLLERHRPFVDRVSDRAELNDLLAHLVGELSALHTFVRGGDLRPPTDSISPGSLGARLVRDEAKGGYRIDHIYRADPEYPDNLSPLGKPMSAIREGEIVASINGVPALSVADPAFLLRHTAGQQVLLEVRPAAGGPVRKEIVVPMTPGAEADLRYSEWEYTRRLEVEKTSKNEIGYVHLRAMGGGNYTEWVKNFYPVFDRKGLVIDVRHNRGGNIDSWVLEKLLRRAWFYWQSRVGKPTWNMQHAFRGHLVVLCNERTASDGEAFAEGFRRLGLGKVIGTRTWGGEIWLSSSNVLVDRGLASAAETGVYGPEGQWLIEGHGVDPDIVVDNLPHATFLGKDAQLEAAVKHLQELIAKDPVEVPKHPPYPDKKK
ncbi:MAG: PD40 domain-containing protein [Candidatus Aminicenantes bacterium]|nr:PD40 domain-containing protein [Candidatus Aminicenantes bacterium]